MADLYASMAGVPGGAAVRMAPEAPPDIPRRTK
jgi:hypothetical protein